MRAKPKPSSPRAVRLIRTMHGGSQARLVEADDGNLYVVKFRNNPQRLRTLVNEIVATKILCAIGLPTAQCGTILFESDFLRDQPISLHLGSHSVPVQPGLHFRSAYASCGRTKSVPVHDSLPSPVLRTIRASKFFIGMYVADQWMANADRRQAVFYRRPGRRWTLKFIDHGQMFGGAKWEFANSFEWGTYSDSTVYESGKPLDDATFWIDIVKALSDDTFAAAYGCVPTEWISEDTLALQNLLDRLSQRRRQLYSIVESMMLHQESPFALYASLGGSPQLGRARRW
jgi:hypothetical protein